MSKRMDKKELIESLKGLIVSCQTQPDNPIHTDDMVVKMAEAAQWGGAVGIRANSPEQIAAIKAKVDLPVIGLWKIWHDNTDVFITPTLEACKAVWESGADIVAPTLYGYTEETKHIEEPDMRAFAQMCRELGDKVSIMMEGHIYTPEDANKLRAFQAKLENEEDKKRVDALYDYWLDHDLKTIYCKEMLTETTVGRFIDPKYPLIATARLSGMMLDYPKLLEKGIGGLKHRNQRHFRKRCS